MHHLRSHFMAKINANFMPKMLLTYPHSIPSLRQPRPHLVRALARLATLALLGFGMALWLNPVWAEKADRAQPLNFAADAARVDDAQRLNVLTGNVEITKGSMLLKADRVEVRQNPDGTQTAVATGGPGGLAFFKQKRDGVNEFVDGWAEKVVYEGRDDTVHFISRAVMRRLKDEVMSDQVAGPLIIYDNKTSVFQVVGDPDKASGPAGSKGRVRGVITPRAADAVPVPALSPTAVPAITKPSVAPAASASAPRP